MDKEIWNVMPSSGMNIFTVNDWQRKNPRDVGMSYNEYFQAHFQEVKDETKKK